MLGDSTVQPFSTNQVAAIVALTACCIAMENPHSSEHHTFQTIYLQIFPLLLLLICQQLG